VIEIGGDQSLAKVEQRPLREYRLDRAEAVEHHLPAQVEQRQLHRRGVRGTRTGLQQYHHRHQPRRMRLLAGASVSVHRLKLQVHYGARELI
jgi:hypothetical protein